MVGCTQFTSKGTLVFTVFGGNPTEFMDGAWACVHHLSRVGQIRPCVCVCVGGVELGEHRFVILFPCRRVG